MIRRPPRSALFPYTPLFRSISTPQGRLSTSARQRVSICGMLTGACLDRKSTRLNSSHSSISFPLCLFFNDPATTEICPLSLHAALPIYFDAPGQVEHVGEAARFDLRDVDRVLLRSEEHTSELQSQFHLFSTLFVF